MTSAHFYKSDLNKIHNIVQNTMNLHSKELVLFSLRDYFSQDTFYRYVTDHFGYPKVGDVTDLPLDAGMVDDSTTRLCIQEAFKMEADFFPAIIVRSGGFNSVPISFNRETSAVQWDSLIFQDGYGNIKTFKHPKYFIFAGAWEGTINVDILARDMRSRDDLVDLVSIRFVDIAFNELVKEGLIVTGVSTSGPSETDDRNHKIFKDTVSLKVRTEWRRLIPVGNIVEVINTAIEFGQLPDGVVAANLTIHTEQTLLEVLSSL
jgi:hypothetical protein